jgi:hypothetical protein
LATWEADRLDTSPAGGAGVCDDSDEGGRGRRGPRLPCMDASDAVALGRELHEVSSLIVTANNGSDTCRCA